ncbi:MAG: aminotransferase class IV [Bacteroidales bacterium]|nr:aminotransferase class IV [Bacteroidales bacterium]
MSQASLFLCYNGRVLKDHEFVASHRNRAFKYGDGFFETMHFAYGHVQLLEQHFERIRRAMDDLQMFNNVLLQPKLIENEIKHLISANHFFNGARVRLTVFREDGGLYRPAGNKANYLIEVASLDALNYPLNSEGLHIDLYLKHSKSTGINYFYKSLNSKVSILGSILASELMVDDCLLINSKGELIESTNSNLFIIKDLNVYTPAIESGCVDGIMRGEVIKIIKNSNLNLHTYSFFTPKDIISFDEIFLTNAIKGIQWVGAYHQKRYDNKITKQLHSQLVKTIMPESFK